MAEEEKKENETKVEENSVKDKFNETLENIKKSEKIEDIYNYAKSNTADTIAYVAMILGILILFFEPFYGGIIIGVVTGLYFSKEIMRPVRNLEGFIEELGMVRSLIFGGLILAFFIKAPMIFIGAAVAVIFKQLVMPDKKDQPENKE
jgi:hypothetical protein